MSRDPADEIDESLADLSLGGLGPSHPVLSTDEDGVISLDLGTEPRVSTAGDGPSELDRFRKEWQAEVQAKKQGVSVGPVRWKSNEVTKRPVSSAGPSTSPRAQWRAMPPDEDTHKEALKQVASSSKILIQPRVSPIRAKRAEDAVEIYARAVEQEQSGQLNEALLLYRRAFKLNDSVDKLYARSRLKIAQEEDPTPTSMDVVSSMAPREAPYSFQRHLQFAPDYESKQSHRISDSPLTTIFNSRPEASSATFLPSEENLPIPIESLPPELLELVFAHLDVLSLERFGAASWKARWLTARSEVWKSLVKSIYKPPGVIPTTWARGRTQEDILAELSERHAGEWRTVMLEEERIRMDGCYIAVCHYVRPGAGDEWVAVTHTITYHRFLRFYPDGTVISFLTTDHPSDVVPILKPSLRGKGLHFGQWRLVRSDSQTDREALKPGEKAQPKVLINSLLEPSAAPKYEFEMELVLRETARGRWNKLDMQSYRSINLSNGEILGLVLKHQRPFYFSKVRSYHPAL
ncbi:hypothetical protein BD324DRAFT_630936 [Kockovaella imperatae]|uniref:F-box domain-containing protein n=1 Tax=Kockovaella imperatae TaxID=4999 RepID=A0A1Y1UC77_9TREE|nr:hypothetical protein BD324DRAFT_630936 [Kockovaella imperatae]ORX35641.1 hypothetical protein BD324DRAFT_630936 [Kockovaella imperatae]